MVVKQNCNVFKKSPYYNSMEVFYMNSCELVTFVSPLACVISDCYTPEEIELMAVVFTQLGDTLSTILVSKEC